MNVLELPDALLGEFVVGTLAPRDFGCFARASQACRDLAERMQRVVLYAEVARRLKAGEEIGNAICAARPALELTAGVTSIGDSAFHRCISLTSITLPAGLTSIGGLAFRYCTSLDAATREQIRAINPGAL